MLSAACGGASEAGIQLPLGDEVGGRLAGERLGVGGFQGIRHAGEQGAGFFAIADGNGQPAGFARCEERLREAEGGTGAEEDGVLAVGTELNQLFFVPK
jgi:hypothetical protein